MIDMLPPGPNAEIVLRTVFLAVNDRAATLEALIGIVAVGGCEAEARAAFDLVMPLGQEDRLDTSDGQVGLMDRAAATLAGIKAPPSLVLH